ncbi:RIP metalloprotease RseP [Anaerohalosphaera lusitana]|uniref:RIP metalloprotease RseP n=1 Tax=Anaerohalosphaera lusitana TaxID=1936003 RepID=A0A1U9NH59_9BACT|nr:site-2 protease family protein [Anaerohalosphaera lusitana]AQT67259.1 RIP metalloprotease RseP [Anaerohalosphaera lusitana]
MDISLGLAWYVVFVLSASFHEAAHAFTAMKFGDRTAYQGGQVTLHPIPHIAREPFGMIVVPIVSFLFNGWMIGWASTPIDPYWAGRNHKKAALMSLSGPASNLLLILVSAALIHIGIAAGFFNQPSISELGFSTIVTADAGTLANGAANMLSICFSLNIVLTTFNLLPVPPLDGTAIVGLFLDRATAEKYQSFIHQPGIALFGLIMAWMSMDFIFPPVYALAVSFLYPGL